MLPAYKAILNQNNKMVKLEDELNLCKMDLDKSTKIRADHAERIRILEIAIQYAIDNSSYKVHSNPGSIDFVLKKAIAESHKIAIKEY